MPIHQSRLTAEPIIVAIAVDGAADAAAAAAAAAAVNKEKKIKINCEPKFFIINRFLRELRVILIH